MKKRGSRCIVVAGERRTRGRSGIDWFDLDASVDFGVRPRLPT